MAADADSNEYPSTTMRAFLEKVPPGVTHRIPAAFERQRNDEVVKLPVIELHCDSPGCKGFRFFSPGNSIVTQKDAHLVGSRRNSVERAYVTYRCNNCRGSAKVYSLEIRPDSTSAVITKFGEMPGFGPLTPARLMSLVASDRELFLKGRRCESQGLGIAAFTYYRRVIEDQKNRIFDEIIRVLKAVSSNHPSIPELEDAKKQVQFSTSVDAIKHGLPDGLMISGHNPLKLLHGALSEGVHALSDEECLERATAIRTVLAEFASRLADMLKDDAELTSAVNKLASMRSGNGRDKARGSAPTSSGGADQT